LPTDCFHLHCLRFRVTFSREATICFSPPQPTTTGNIYLEATRLKSDFKHWF